MKASKVRIGQLVRSRSGRDSGTWFAVVGREGDRYLRIADGSMRRVCQPKRKNIKHLDISSSVLEDIGQDLAAGRPVLDSKLRKTIAEWESTEHTTSSQPGSQASKEEVSSIR